MRAKIPFILLGLVFAAGASRAQEAIEVAVIDMTRAFKAHPETRVAETGLKAAQKENRDAFKEKSGELKELLEDHQALTNKMIEAGTAARDEDKAQAKALLERASKLEKEVAALKTTQQRDLEQRFLAERRRIIGLIQKTVAEFNKDGRYALVFDSSAKSENGLPQLLHHPGATDITDKVIALFALKAKKIE